MAKTVLTQVQVMVNSVNLSSWIDTVTLEQTYADIETTAFGQSSKTRIAGLGDHKCTLDFQQDWALAAVEPSILPLVGTTTQVVVTPMSGTASSTNPAYTFTVLVTSWKDIDGKIGDLSKSSVTWPISGAISYTAGA
jgi:3D (Asp-Asp-Asp) domain-containing protein